MTLFVTFLARYQLITTRWNGSHPAIPPVTPTTLMFFCSFMLMRDLRAQGQSQDTAPPYDNGASSTTAPTPP